MQTSIQVSTALYCSVLYCPTDLGGKHRFKLVLCCIAYSEYSVLYCTVLYCTVLYCTVLYCRNGIGFDTFAGMCQTKVILLSMHILRYPLCSLRLSGWARSSCLPGTVTLKVNESRKVFLKDHLFRLKWIVAPRGIVRRRRRRRCWRHAAR